jgi:acyl transferase domain-containing protein
MFTKLCEVPAVYPRRALQPMLLCIRPPAGMLSPEGRCKTLDASADGYVRAEAVGAIIIEAWSSSSIGSSSRRGARHALAIVAGSSVNQDGRSSSLTAPNGPAQQEVLRAALTDAGMTPAYMSGLSMHGTGTPLGKLW